MQNEKKEWVKERYGAIAESGGSCCPSGSACSCGNTASAVASGIGYTVEDLEQIPEGANLGLGCGNPLGIEAVREGETVLDLGSGAGMDAFLAAAKVGAAGRVIGVDMTPSMIETARRNAASSGYANVEFRLGDIEAMPVEDCSVDLVISNCVLNLVPDKKAAFSEIVRVLKPGGRIAVSDIVLDGALPDKLIDDPDGYCACISGASRREDYLQGLEQAGLVSVTVVRSAGGDFGIPGLKGVAASITVKAQKPRCCCC